MRVRWQSVFWSGTGKGLFKEGDRVMKRNTIFYCFIIFTILIFSQFGDKGNDLIDSRYVGWYVVADYSHLIDAVIYITQNGSIQLFCVESGAIYDFIIKKESLLISTSNEVFELKYIEKEGFFNKKTFIEFPEGTYYSIKIVGEIDGGIWLLCGSPQKPFDVQQELIYVKDNAIRKKVSLESLLGIIDNANKEECYTIRSDSLGNTIYFVISPILFTKDETIRYYVLNPIKNEWELLFKRKEKIISPLIIYDKKIFDLGTDLKLDMPFYLKENGEMSSGKMWLEQSEGSYIFFEERFNEGYFVVQKEIKQEKINKIKISRKYRFLGTDTNGIYVYDTHEISKLKIEF